MKGSPIIATAIACIIMLAMFIGMRTAFSSSNTPPNNQPSNTTPTTPNHQTSAYAEIYFSTTPHNFNLTHPVTGTTILKVDQPQNSEWNGTITIPAKNLTTEEIEILCQANWESSTKSAPKGNNFIQVTISPDDLDPQTQTLRATSNIADILTYQWKEEQ